MGGYRDYCAVPMPKLHLYALALAGRGEAQEAQMKDATKGAGKGAGASTGARDEVQSVNRSDWRQLNKTTGDYVGSRE